jgi:hypothetical protein
MDKNARIRSIVSIVIFVMIIGILTIVSMVKEDDGFSENENRILAQKPEFSVDELINGSYIEDYQDYIRDQFPWRDEMVKLKNVCELFFGKSMINGVLIAEDDYYIESHERENYESELAETNAEALISFVNRHKETLGEDRVSAMIVPTAQSIMTNKFSSFMYAYNQQEYILPIKEKIGNSFIDVTEVLKSKNDEYIYYRTDHHWTTYGAYIAYAEWASRVGITPYTEDELEIKDITKEFYGTIDSKINLDTKSDIIKSYEVKGMKYNIVYNMSEEKNTFFFDEFLDKKDKYSYFLGGNPGLVEVKGTSDNDRKLLIVKDSYANCISPVYAGHFENTYILDLRYFNMRIDDFISEYGITDILVLYNVDSFATDKYVKRIR